MEQQRGPEDFVRPTLNSPLREGTADAELFIRRIINRLDASREANMLAGVYMSHAPRPPIHSWYTAS
jgi:hypothetical protein